uniref:Uncharacterized protein n=1 Tax=Hordeum vulgare subsp. vulgare TaxID=112509 RepID=A0A8I6WB99_HORVV
MEGFSPPDRRVAPPPATADYEMLIHVDRVEDWAPPSPCSSHSGQSGIPSSGSDNDGKPFPAVSSAPLTVGVEDAQRPDRQPRLQQAPVADLGCRGLPWGNHERDHDGDGNGGSRVGGHRSWKDVLLHRGPVAPAVDELVSKGKDPVDDFFRTAKKPSLASTAVDGLAADVQAAAEAVVTAPLEFDTNALDRTPGEALQLDAFSPTLSASASEFGQYNRATPTAAGTLEVQLGAVTSRVCQLEIAEAEETAEEGSLFRAPKPPLISRPPPAARRSAFPPKSRAISVPTRHSARQAAVVSTVPVAQRASLRIVKELGLLGPTEKMTAEVAKVLLHRFEEPLTDSDISVIAKLTRLDGEALWVMARMDDTEGAAEEAAV